jgi:hypothetical protein
LADGGVGEDEASGIEWRRRKVMRFGQLRH